MNRLPKWNFVCLKHFVSLFYLVSQNSSVNKMDIHNIAVCVAPSIFYKFDRPNDVESSFRTIAFLEYLIENMVAVFEDDSPFRSLQTLAQQASSNSTPTGVSTHTTPSSMGSSGNSGSTSLKQQPSMSSTHSSHAIYHAANSTTTSSDAKTTMSKSVENLAAAQMQKKQLQKQQAATKKSSVGTLNRRDLLAGYRVLNNLVGLKTSSSGGSGSNSSRSGAAGNSKAAAIAPKILKSKAAVIASANNPALTNYKKKPEADTFSFDYVSMTMTKRVEPSQPVKAKSIDILVESLMKDNDQTIEDDAVTAMPMDATGKKKSEKRRRTYTNEGFLDQEVATSNDGIIEEQPLEQQHDCASVSGGIYDDFDSGMMAVAVVADHRASSEQTEQAPVVSTTTASKFLDSEEDELDNSNGNNNNINDFEIDDMDDDDDNDEYEDDELADGGDEADFNDESADFEDEEVNENFAIRKQKKQSNGSTSPSTASASNSGNKASGCKNSKPRKQPSGISKKSKLPISQQQQQNLFKTKSTFLKNNKSAAATKTSNIHLDVPISNISKKQRNGSAHDLSSNNTLSLDSGVSVPTITTANSTTTVTTTAVHTTTSASSTSASRTNSDPDEEVEGVESGEDRSTASSSMAVAVATKTIAAAVDSGSYLDLVESEFKTTAETTTATGLSHGSLRSNTSSASGLYLKRQRRMLALNDSRKLSGNTDATETTFPDQHQYQHQNHHHHHIATNYGGSSSAATSAHSSASSATGLAVTGGRSKRRAPLLGCLIVKQQLTNTSALVYDHRARAATTAEDSSTVITTTSGNSVDEGNQCLPCEAEPLSSVVAMLVRFLRFSLKFSRVITFHRL
jgi:hypothetical protein